jgi:hypothetical protein
MDNNQLSKTKIQFTDYDLKQAKKMSDGVSNYAMFSIFQIEISNF